MTQGEAKQWLDALIEANEHTLMLINKYKDSGVEACGNYIAKELHIYEGINILAEALGTKLQLKHFDFVGCQYPNEYSFMYRGYIVYQQEKEVVPGWTN